MNPYNDPRLTPNAQALRKGMTKEERRLWYDFLKKLPVTFNRQKVIGRYIVDFYCASANLVIELDGSQHYEVDGTTADIERDVWLTTQGLTVLRFSNRDVNRRFKEVCERIYQTLDALTNLSLPTRPNEKGATDMNQNRIQKVIENMHACGLSQILVTSPANVYYLTGVWCEPYERMLALHVRQDGGMTLYANRMFALDGLTDVPMVTYEDTDDCIAVLAPDILPGKIGIDKTWHSHFTIRLMQARPDVAPALGSAPLDEARVTKDEDELELMRESSRKNVAVCASVAAALREGVTEKAMQALYIENARVAGSPGPSFTPLVCFGKNGAEPHHDSDGTALRPGDTVIMDVGLLWQRYCSDMTRTVHFGEVSDEQKRVRDIVTRANRAGIAMCRPGVRMKDIDRAARSVIEEAGYGRYFTHRTGHGIGLDEHEFPDVSSVSEVVARPGMVFSVEPGIYLPDRFGVRVEDLVAITEDGCEVLSRDDWDD